MLPLYFVLAISLSEIDWDNRKCPSTTPPVCPLPNKLIPQIGWDENYCNKAPTCCGNNVCEGDENLQNCPKDCNDKLGPVCGNNICEKFEETFCSPCIYSEKLDAKCLPCVKGDCQKDCEKESLLGCLKDGESGTPFMQECCLGLVEKYAQEDLNNNSVNNIPKFTCVKCNGEYCQISYRESSYERQTNKIITNNNANTNNNSLNKNANKLETTKDCPKMSPAKCDNGKIISLGKDKNGCEKLPMCVKKLSNGKENDIKILPDSASLKAIEKLGDLGWNIVLKAVGEKNNEKYVYNLNGEKQVKILGLFKENMNITAEVNAETGEVNNIKKPWWSFLAW